MLCKQDITKRNILFLLLLIYCYHYYCVQIMKDTIQSPTLTIWYSTFSQLKSAKQLARPRGTGATSTVRKTLQGDQGSVSQNLSSVTNDRCCHKLVKCLLLIGYQQICHWILSFVIEKRLCETDPSWKAFLSSKCSHWSHFIFLNSIEITTLGIDPKFSYNFFPWLI